MGLPLMPEAIPPILSISGPVAWKRISDDMSAGPLPKPVVTASTVTGIWMTAEPFTTVLR